MKSNKLTEVLVQARSLGFLGPGPVKNHIEHAETYGQAIVGFSDSVADLGAGGGVPSLPLLIAETLSTVVLVDASQKRCSFLQWALIELDLVDRAEVYCGRAETFAHEVERRNRFSCGIARGFGPPSSTLECGAPLLREGGRCIISEPPQRRNWPDEGLDLLALKQKTSFDGLAVFESLRKIDKKFPRKASLQKKVPLFTLEK